MAPWRITKFPLRASTCWSQLQSHFLQRSSGHGASRNLSETKNFQKSVTPIGPPQAWRWWWTWTKHLAAWKLHNVCLTAHLDIVLLVEQLRDCGCYMQAKSAAPVEFIKQLKEVIHETTQCIGLSLVAHVEKVWKFKERSTTSNRSSMHVSPRLLIPQNTSSPLGNEGQLQPYPGGVSCFWQNMPRFTMTYRRVKNSKVSTVQQVGLLVVLSFFNLSCCLNPWRVHHNMKTKSSYKFKNVNDGQTAVRTHESRWCFKFWIEESNRITWANNLPQ